MVLMIHGVHCTTRSTQGKKEPLRDQAPDSQVEANWGGESLAGSTTASASAGAAPKRRKIEGATGEIRCLRCKRSSKDRVPGVFH